MSITDCWLYSLMLSDTNRQGDPPHYSEHYQAGLQTGLTVWDWTARSLPAYLGVRCLSIEQDIYGKATASEQDDPAFETSLSPAC